MKKNYFYLLTTMLVAMLSFTACNDDDDNDDTLTNRFELYLDDVKQNVFSETNIEYNSSNFVGEPQLKVYIYGGEGSQFTVLTLTYDNLKLSDIKVGDDLITKDGVETYYMLIADKGGYSVDETSSNIGQAIVKSFDSSNNNIALEFTNVRVTNGKNSFISMKGYIASTIELR